MKQNREYRKIDVAGLETRSDGDNSMIVEGYATTFNQPYELWHNSDYTVMEQVDGHAFDHTDMRDVIMQYDHEGRVFARVKNGTLRVEPDEHGLKISADLGGTEIGRQLYEEIKGGYIDKMSIGFTVKDSIRTEKRDEETGKTEILRTIAAIEKLYDVSAVSLPANDATEISVRNIGEGVIADVVQELNAAKERRRKIAIAKALLEV